MKLYKKVKARLHLLNYKRKSYVELSFDKKIPRLKLHEKYRKHVIWTLRFLTLLGIISSFLSFIPIIAGLITLTLLGIQTFIEKTTYHYNSLYVQPLPDFEYKPDEWRAVVYGVPTEEKVPFLIGLCFETEEYANQIFSLLRAYNNNENVDSENNICISLIIKNVSSYYFLIYPNDEKEIIKSTRDQITSENKLEKYGLEHQQLVMQLVVCKEFPYKSNTLTRFRENYRDGESYQLSAYIFDDGELREIKEIEPIYKDTIKIKRKELLDKTDIEYSYLKVADKF
ncbi:hypothetical protein [Sporosarcina sp. FA9]|uniref:hypothetical protein n=1 Tax=Sporosarcina sp. FA9 TaxID=3413030 RepID=UPI003F65815B